MSDLPPGRAELLEWVRCPPPSTADQPPLPLSFVSSPTSFHVEELAAYEPCGEGEHLYLRIEKRGLNTKDAVTSIARQLGLDPRAAGWAGLKDRHATTSQWISLHAPTAVDVTEGQTFGEQLRVLSVSRHGNKLRSGHLTANRFTLRLSELPEQHEARLMDVLERLQAVGLPNYFGAQRFGHAGRNLLDALSWLVDGGRAPRAPFMRKLLMSTFQAAIFNHVLARRVQSGALATAREGDWMRKEPAGGQFLCEDAQTDDPRVKGWEISPTGPMFGAKMREAAGEVGRDEAQALGVFGGDAALLERSRRFGEGTRRSLRVRPQGVKTRREGADLWLHVDLPAGSYATVLVAELTHAPLWSPAA